jgi:DNA-binding GntR family transcriptional regulator
MSMMKDARDRGRASAVDPVDSLTPTPALMLSHEVIDRLRDSILRGRLPTGYRLREERIAEALGVSRGPVRNALVQLEREGLAIRRPNRGAIVAELSRRDLEEVFSIRSAVEPVACAWAAANAEPAELDEMEAIVNAYAKLTSRVTNEAAAEADLRFHDVVYRASRHKRLISLWRDLRPQVYVFMLARRYVREREFREIMIAGHARIRDAIARGDEQQARAAAAEHVQTSYTRVLAEYDAEVGDPAGG